MGKYFGTDGFRGEANKDLTFDHAIKIGRFLGWYYGKNMGKKAKVVIGKDTRRSSYMFEYALCTGLMASGAAPPPGLTAPPCQFQPSSEISPPPPVPNVKYLPSLMTTEEGSWIKGLPVWACNEPAASNNMGMIAVLFIMVSNL